MDNPSLPALQQTKRMDYEYDLVSGNVNMVHFQKGEPDQYHHSYCYDADNRITDVFTSNATLPFEANVPGSGGGNLQVDHLFDNDARYEYYDHGPLARTELGDNKVQGIDFAYTIQGWIKGVNSDALSVFQDIGQDGRTLAAPLNVNKHIAEDAFGFSLGYFENDYTKINVAAPQFLASTAGSGLLTDRNDLFNGNISHMVTTFEDINPVSPTVGEPLPQGTAYLYDQLNRIKRMRAHRNLVANAWGTGSGDDGSYQADYTYDENGNMIAMERKGTSEVNLAMDDLTMIHETIENGYNRNTNRLRQVIDAVPSGNYTDDLDSQNPDNFNYDEIGNLISDQFECIENIEWSVYGKVLKVTRIEGCETEGTEPSDLEFHYDANGNMVEKVVKPDGQENNEDEWIRTYYVRDATGNIMTTYIQKPVSEGGDFILEEQQLYGSSHIGTRRPGLDLNQPMVINKTERTMGLKHYILSDHRGNNNVMVSDKKIPLPAFFNPDLIDHYIADVERTVDYYPFGREMNGRIVNRNFSEFGYNGKQNIPEWSSRLTGVQNYGFRIKYDWGFLSVDPLAKDFAELTPYNYASNRVIDGVDVNGLQWSKNELSAGDWTLVYFNIDIKILNNTTLPKAGSKNLIRNIIEQTEKTLKAVDNEKKIKYSTKVRVIEWVNPEGDLDPENDFYIELTDDIDLGFFGNLIKGFSEGQVIGKVEEIGNTEQNRIQVKTADPINPRARRQVSRTGTHELGHTGGLSHPDEKIVKSNPSLKTNIMRQSKHTSGTSIIIKQLEKIRTTIDNNKQGKVKEE